MLRSLVSPIHVRLLMSPWRERALLDPNIHFLINIKHATGNFQCQAQTLIPSKGNLYERIITFICS